MTHNNPKIDLLILGVYPESEGYPNIKYRLADLADTAEFSVTTLHEPIWQHNINAHAAGNKLNSLWRFIWAHCLVLYRYLRTTPTKRVYIPYPAVFISYLLSFLPRKLRPKRLVLDAFISLYDTVVFDRKLLSANHLLAKVLFAIERRAYAQSFKVIVDTSQNATYLAKLFNLPSTQFVAIPLSTNEHCIPTKAYTLPQSNQFRILFVGTLIPLHGIEVILETIVALANHRNLQFKIIGTGQLSPLIAHYQHEHFLNLIWEESWISQDALIAEVVAADICLGIFGTTAKADRVCPLKLYTYATCGRAIITADTDCLNALGVKQSMVLIQSGSSEALTEAILELTSQPALLTEYAENSKQFYQRQLANESALAAFKTLLTSPESM